MSRLSLLCLVLLTAALASPAAAQTQSCAAGLEAAERFYQEGRFDEAIQEITPCLSSDAFSRDQTIRAHRLVSMAHTNNGDAEGARLAVLDLLRRVPDYEADPVQDPPAYVELVALIRGQAQPAIAQPPARSWAKKPATWLSVGAGLIVVGLAAVLSGETGPQAP